LLPTRQTNAPREGGPDAEARRAEFLSPKLPAKTVAHLRWYICGLLFFATTGNYVDRQVISLLKPVLEQEFNWSEATYGWIVFSFQLAYAIMMPLAGRAIDYLGTRLGYMLAMLLWSVAAMAHALAGSALGFGAARFALGIGESANFPAALKTVAHWFPRKERALATGIFNSGANVGALLVPILVPYLVLHFGWRSAFLFTGVPGLMWAVLWYFFFREPEDHPKLSATELELIRSDHEESQSERHVPYLELLGSRAAWAFLIGKFLTDPVWWFFLFWLPGFLNKRYELELSDLGLPLVVIYTASMVGSIGGGWISSALLHRGWTVNRARKTAMLICAVAVTASIFVYKAGDNLWLAVTLISIAAAAHQGWSANIFNLPSDVFPQRSVASVVGFGGVGGAVGGLLASPATGYWLKWSDGAYAPLFIFAGSLYLVALGIIQLLVPDIETAR
jgi:ACS family hexuronate transporter-like MFS transporter